MPDIHFKFSDPIQCLSISLHQALQLYLEGYGGRSIGAMTNFNIPPRAKFDTAMAAIKKIIAVNRWDHHFSATWQNTSREESLERLFDGFKNITAESQRLGKNTISLDQLSPLSTDKIAGISSDKTVLRIIIDKLLGCSEYYKIVVLDGSIGSGDFKPGWSDIDIFMVLESSVLQSPIKLKKMRKIAIELQQLIYQYCILQLHGIFYSTNYNLDYHLDTLFPLNCLMNGMNHCTDRQLVLHSPTVDQSAMYYFTQHIYNSSKILLSKIPSLNTIQKVLLMHRIYAFPFAFLAARAIYRYKREAFNTLRELYADAFSGIARFYNDLNGFYHLWHVDKLRTINMRHRLNGLFDMRFINRLFLRWEPNILSNIERFFQFFLHKNYDRQFNDYLEISRRLLAENNL